jgi:hypothetical protein
MSITFMECCDMSPLLKRGHVRALQIKRWQLAFASPAILHTVVRFNAKR